MTAAAHRVTRPADRLIDRLQSIMINRAMLVAQVKKATPVAQYDGAALYVTPAGRYFIFDGYTVFPISEGDALVLKGES